MTTQTDSYELAARDGTPFPTTARRNQAGVEVLHRADRIRAGMVAYHKTRELIVEAWNQRDWSALGYDSWDNYIKGEFESYRVKLTTEERIESVTALRLEGMSQRAIASAVGVSQRTVERDLDKAPVDANASTDEEGAAKPWSVTGVGGRPYPSHRPSQRRPSFGKLAAMRGVSRRGSLLSQLGAVDLTRAEEMAGDPATWDGEQDAVLEATQRLIDALERIETKVMA